MRHYELVTILSPMLNQEESAETWGRIKDFITGRNGEIVEEQVWGTRRLAYPIRKGSHNFLEGTYHATRFSTEKSFNQELEAFLRFDERILRSLVVVADPKTALTQPTTAVGRWGGRGPGGAPPYRGGPPAGAPAGAPPAETPAAEAPAATEEAPPEVAAPAAVEEPPVVEAAAPEETPVAEAPVAEAPVAEAPAEETPVAEAPEAEEPAPDAEAGAAEEASQDEAEDKES